MFFVFIFLFFLLCRAIVWLQNRREATVERSRTASAVRRDDPGEFRVGRLKHERVKVPRGDSLMEWAENVMQIHADRKSVLEVKSELLEPLSGLYYCLCLSLRRVTPFVLVTTVTWTESEGKFKF